MLATMPLYLDRHDLDGATAADVAGAHLKDLDAQERFSVRFLSYWFDYERQTAFCLAEGPDGEAINAAHAAAHGLVANSVIEVDPTMLRRFMMPPEHPPGEPYVETAFRTVMFTDIEGSTDLTQRMGDRGAMEMVRAHDRIVRAALKLHAGTEVKHTGDGILASFASVSDGIAGAIEVQRRLTEEMADADVPFRLRIGMAAGEPVTENDDLFGAAVQLASRLCARATPGTVLVSSTVRDLALGKGFTFESRGSRKPKGFSESVRVFELQWAAEASPGG
jgi:class 3 adenylate cyclase